MNKLIQNAMGIYNKCTVYDMQYGTMKCTHTICNLNQRECTVMRVARIEAGLLGTQVTYCMKIKADHLDQVHSDQKVLKVIRWGRLVLLIRNQESQS
jgi:hypothetical protein